MNFGTVFPGEKYTPSATQQNLLNQMLSNYNTRMTVGGAPDNSLNPNSVRISVRHVSGNDYGFEFGQVVYIYGVSDTPDAFGNLVYNASQQPPNRDAPVAVIERAQPPYSSMDRVSTAIISGIAIARIYISSTIDTYTGKARPNNNGTFIIDENGRFSILYAKRFNNYSYGYGWVVLGGQTQPVYLFGVYLYQSEDEEGNTRTYADIYSVPEWIGALGRTKRSTLIPTVIDITDALAQGRVEIGVKIVGLDNEDITDGSFVCQYVINGYSDNRPLQPYRGFVVIDADLDFEVIPYGDGVFHVDEFTGSASCWSYYDGDSVKVVCRTVYDTSVNPRLSADTPQTVFDYPGDCALFFVLNYNETDGTYSGAWQLLASGTPDGMYIQALNNKGNNREMEELPDLNFFNRYLL